MRDMRDPQELGQQILNRPKQMHVLAMADVLDKRHRDGQEEVVGYKLITENGDKPQGE